MLKMGSININGTSRIGERRSVLQCVFLRGRQREFHREHHQPGTVQRQSGAVRFRL